MMKGYKVFNPDWTCRGFQYEVGKTFEENVTPFCCKRGFHFCKELKDCFNYYPFDPNNKVAIVIALGEIDKKYDSEKYCTNKIQILEEISWEDVLRMINIGKENTGLCNSGDRNSGNHNSGNRNSGNCNSGVCNSGNFNSGNYNSGNRNSGNCNSGLFNSGDCNSGNRNSGDYNSGYWNSGKRNIGNCNSGYRNSGNYNSGGQNTGECNSGAWNSGYRNSGNYNSGSYNSGHHNSGNRNSGNYNSGNHNSGDWNSTDFSSGCFNTEEQKIMMFNKPSGWTYRDWLNSDARLLLTRIQKNAVEWIKSSGMTEEEKKAHPEHEVTGGYLKTLDEKDCGQNWWDSLNDDEKDIIKSLPNFDAEIFEKCTGVKIV